MTPQPLRVRVLAALELAPMTVNGLSRYLRASRYSVEKRLADLRSVGVVKSSAMRQGLNGHPVHLYRVELPQ